MSSADQSNVAIKINPCEEPQDLSDELPDQNPQEIDIAHTPIITQNVPFTNPLKPVSPCYIIFNIHLSCALILLITLLQMSWLGQLAKYLLISYAIISYILYLAVAYHFSNLIFLTDLRSLHEYESVFGRLVSAECALKFCYIPARNRIDEGFKKYEEEYKQVRIVDRSGKLYHIQRHYSLALIRYRKRFYYSDSKVRAKVTGEFHNFTQKCRREFQNNKKKLLNSKEKIELVIGDMTNEIGYYIQEDNHYKTMFIATLLLGFGACFEYCMGRKVLRYQMDIVKEICLK